MRPLRYAPPLLPLLLCGCHVVERAERCQELAAIMSEAAPEIATTRIEDSPSAQVLRKKARLYGQLGDRLGKVQFKDAAIADEQKLLVLHLHNLEKQLLDAGDAVEAEAAFEKRQEEMRLRHEQILAEKEKYAASHQEKEPAGGMPSAPKHGPTEQGPGHDGRPPAHGPHRMPGFLDRGKRTAPPEKATPLRRVTSNTRKYERAKHAAENIGRAVETSARNLEKACR